MLKNKTIIAGIIACYALTISPGTSSVAEPGDGLSDNEPF